MLTHQLKGYLLPFFLRKFVIKKPNDPITSAFKNIDKVSKNKVKNGMAVLDGPFLIGKVVEVNYATSRVLLISDLNSKIPILVEPGNFRSILSGTGKNFATILYSKDEQKIIKDQVIYTSGSGGIFKAGIPVGKTIDDEKVEFFSKLSQLSFVKLVSFSKENN